MFRGETIKTVISGFPVPIINIKDVRIVFKYNGKIILEKAKSDCTIDGETLTFTLTQEESLKLTIGDVSRSIIVVTNDGARFESKPSLISVAQTAKGEII